MFFSFGVAIFLLVVQEQNCQSLQLMNPDEQIRTMNLKLQNFLDPFTYGIWSRYSPLSSIGQVGKIGLFDSNCLHYHHASSKTTNLINFIYYDCLDNEAKEIMKVVKFVDDKNEEHIFKVLLDFHQYEYVWYYFQITQWPQLKTFQIIILQQEIVLLFSTLQITFPFFDNDLILTFGGGGKFIFGAAQLSQSYFPGQMILSIQNEVTLQPEDDQISFITRFFNFHCQCISNYDYEPLLIKSKQFQANQLLVLSSLYPNCEQFTLIGWIKVMEIISSGKDFSYKFLKIATDNENSRLTVDDLSPICLSYFISDQGNKIIFTTYSYNFPSVNIDFSDNPFLITTEFYISNNILLWHSVTVKLYSDLLLIKVTFYEGLRNYIYEKIIEVKQFHLINFQVQIGNILGQLENYLNAEIYQIYFFNCDSEQIETECHSSCYQCDGPTQFDCLSCAIDSNRKYLSDKKQCVCPVDSIDSYTGFHSQCLSLQDLTLQSINSMMPATQCPFGFFEVDNSCFQCPEIVNHVQINCLDCLMNPKQWINMLFCKTNIVNDNGNMYQPETETLGIQYFIFDSTEIKYCENCTSSCLKVECIFDDYTKAQQQIISKEHLCFECQTESCTQHCIVCNQSLCYACFLPYYLTADRSKCNNCPITNCKFCFEYLPDDLTFSTLYKNFEMFTDSDTSKVQIGCSLCVDGFSFDFTIGKCIQRRPELNNCIRSYIDLSGQEICTLSGIDDFDIAPQIINCQFRISHCEQCILTPNQVIKCIICAEGYTTSIKTGHCDACELENAKSCVEGDYIFYDYWKQFIQSFTMQFSPDHYYYPKPSVTYFIITFPSQCIDGYKPNTNYQCQQYCDYNCLNCIENEQHIFVCNSCQNNVQGLTVQSQYNGSCLSCSELCIACQPRSNEEILMINPHFINSPENISQTYQCFQTRPEAGVTIDPQLSIAKYCFQGDCSQSLQYQLLLVNCYDVNELRPEDSYENQQNLEFYQKIGLRSFSLMIWYNVDLAKKSCSSYQQIEITTSLKYYIFSLQYTEVQIIGNQEKDNNFTSNLFISNFNAVYFVNFVYYAKIDQYNIIIENQQEPIDLSIKDSIIYGIQTDEIQFSITLIEDRNLNLQNVTFKDLHLKDVIIVEYNSNIEETIIELVEISIENCIFYNVTLFAFLRYQSSIKISKLTIINSHFLETTLLKYNSTELNDQGNLITSIIIQNCIITSSIMFMNIGNSKILVQNILLRNNEIRESIIIQSQLQTDIQNLILLQNHFFSSFLFYSNQLSKTDVVSFSFNNFEIVGNKFSNSSLFYIHQNFSKGKVSVQITDFVHSHLEASADQIEHKYLYDISCSELLINNFLIQETRNVPFVRAYFTSKILIKGMQYQNLIQSFKISTSKTCFTEIETDSKLLYIQGFHYVKISNVSIINITSVDNSIIQIWSDPLYSQNTRENIEISNINCFGNVLLKSNLGQVFSMFVVYSNQQQQISLNSIIFRQNFFHQLVDDPSETTASLIYISSQLSIVGAEQIFCISNGLTNSSYPFISISSRSVTFNYFSVLNSNILENTIWTEYYNIQSEILLSDSIMNQFLQELFIENSGGVCQISSSEIYFTNSTFKNLISQSSVIFNFITQGEGIVQLSDITIIKASTVLTQNIETDGCITLYSKNSQLHLQMKNIVFQEVTNRLGPAILSITPSLLKNIITLMNITSLNSISLLNSVMQIQFSQSSAINNHLFFTKLNFTQTEEGWNQYLQLIHFTNSAEIKKIMSENALINLEECSITIENSAFQGFFISPIVSFRNVIKLTINHLIIEDSEVLFPFTLIQYSQSQEIQNQIILQEIFLRNISQTVSSQDLFNKITTIGEIYSVSEGCGIRIIDFLSNEVNYTINALIELLNNGITLKGSLVSFQDLSGKSKVNVKQIYLFNNNCRFCYDGMISFGYSLMASMIFDGLVCYQNNIQSFGCLSLSSELDKTFFSNLVIIKNSVFSSNNGTNGVAIFSSNAPFKLQSSLIRKNIALNLGGGLLIKNTTPNFLLNGTSIFDNSAQIGGGLFLEGNSSLTKTNFIKSFLLFNRASISANNLVEAPDHLSLRINQKEIASINEYTSGGLISHLDLNIYSYFEQGKRLFTKDLFLPSNQKIMDYKIFDINKQRYISYISDFTLLFKNSRNENLQGYAEDQCKIELKVHKQFDKITVDGEKISFLLNFNQDINGFDLGSLTFNFDPYSLSKPSFELYFTCKSQSILTTLMYGLIAKTFKCQLGEFYAHDGCQPCESSFGFYSVTYNATKCSIFDKTKFDNITSNQIKLKNGYWRPSYQSDLTENCFKNELWCIGGWNINNDLCYLGHIGGLCEECDIYNIRGNGRYFKTSNTTCVLCQNGTLIPFILITLWSLFSILITLKSIRNSNNLFLVLKAKTKLFETLFRLSQGNVKFKLDFESILLKMLLNYLWIFSTIFTFNITFGFSVDFVNQASSPSYFMAMNIDCSLKEIEYIQLIYLRIIAMLLIIVIQIIVIQFGFTFYSIITNAPYDSSVLSNTVIYLFVCNQPALIQSFGSLIAARQISEINFIQGNVALQFYDSDHQKWIFAFILPGLGIFGVFLPFSLFLILLISKKRFVQSSFRKHICYLFNEYNNENYFWEQIKIWKRSIIIIILLYFETSIQIKAFLISLALLFYQFIAVNNRPYITKSLNTLDVQSGQIVSTAIFVAAIKYMSQQDNNYNISTLLQILLILLCLRLCYYFVLNIIQVYVKKYKLMVLTNLHIIVSRMRVNNFLALYFDQQIKNYLRTKEQLSENYAKLRLHLISISKCQLELQRNSSPYQSRRNLNMFSAQITNRTTGICKTTLLLKEDK